MNPRILKEIKLADSLNYDISFLGFHLGNWSDELDRKIQKQMGSPKYIYLDASRKKFLPWLRRSLLERLNKVVWKWNKSNLFLASTASTKRAFSLVHYANKVNAGDYDLVIGHTLGSLLPASIVSARAGCPFAFDLEDYHPGEHIERGKYDEIKRRELIMKTILPDAAYISASSPIIAHLTKELCGFDEQKITPVLNFFPAGEFQPPVPISVGKIKLIWFSQFISAGRGLELILPVWESLKDDFELTLIGGSSNEMEGILQEGILLLPPLPQPELHARLSQYDIGLALELTHRDINKDSALSNKMLAYYQAGLYILATDTAAQSHFINQHPLSGKLFSQKDNEGFLKAIAFVRENISDIRSGSLQRYRQAAVHSWEIESGKLKTIWERILN